MRFTITVLFSLLPMLAAHARPELSPEQLSAIEKLITERMSADEVPGLSVAVAMQGELSWSAGYGMADLENFVPATAQTRFRTASISKWLTSTAALRLVEEGKLDLSAPVQRYCAAYPVKRWPMSVRQLLSHTAGVRHYRGDNDEPRDTEAQRAALAELMRQERIGQYFRYTDVTAPLVTFKDDPLVFEPGTRFHYTSNGYRLVGCVLEGASGESYQALMRRAVFGPARMPDTTEDDAWAIIPHRAAGYVSREEGGLRRADFRDVSENLPAGGHLSTSADLVRFAAAFNGGRLVRPASVAEMVARPALPGAPDPDGFYGLGIQVKPFAGGQMWSHTGGQSGVSTCLYLLPDEVLAVAVMMNKEDGPARELCAAIAMLMHEQAAAKPTQVPSESRG